MHEPDRRPSPFATRAPWWAWPLLLPGPLLAWYEIVEGEAERSALASAFSPSATAWIALVGLSLAVVGESLVYGMLWSARGRRLPFATSVLVLLQLTLLDVLALALVESPPDAGPGRALACVLAGPRVAWGESGPGGMANAFGALGGLTLVRMAIWAWAQSEAVGRRWRDAAWMVASVWLVSHAALGVLAELARGRSVTS